MALKIILLIVLVGAVLTLIWLVVKKLPQLKVIDPSSSKDAKAKELKQDLLRQRFERATAGPLATAKASAMLPMRAMQGLVRSSAAKLRAIERSYAERQKAAKTKLDKTDVRKMLDEASALLRDEKYEEAEKRLIELITIDPKNTEAYELLGRVYLLTKEYVNAKEAFTHCLKLSPKDASIHASLGELAELQGDAAKAFSHFDKARELSPNNPKYLDFYIGAAISVDKFYEAEQGLDALRRVNPENQKIALFAERLAEARARVTKG